MRIDVVRMVSLAFLLSLLVLTRNDGLLSWVYGIAFLFFSFIIFRFLDDAGSVFYDRKHHPDRDYLNSRNYPEFLVITGLAAVAYLVILFLISFKMVVIVSILLVVSAGLYLIFRKVDIILYFIPLIKYPVLLFILSNLLKESVSETVLFSSFFLLYAFDELETINEKSSNLWKSLVLLLICGLLLFQPWQSAYYLVFALLPLGIAALIKNLPWVQYLPVVYYPIAYFAVTNI